MWLLNLFARCFVCGVVLRRIAFFVCVRCVAAIRGRSGAVGGLLHEGMDRSPRMSAMVREIIDSHHNPNTFP